ncbi:acetyltransferase [Salmonella enterica subsp. enterica]|uniref:Acetyltransferase n=1 Tax=Salmonella enterica I TaxID=59201 RepID=A0A3S4LY70_SALET|nr:acetyltransferase [Salmonella enterica subsp. enterica]
MRPVNYWAYPVLVSEENGVVTGYASFGDWRSFDGFSLYRRALGLCSSGAPGERTGAKAAQQTDRRSPTLRQACDGGRYWSPQNAASIRLHHSLGFTVTAQMPQVGVKFGRWLDLTFMQLQLDEHAAPDAC